METKFMPSSLPVFPVQNFVSVTYQGNLVSVPVPFATRGSTTQPAGNGGLQVLNQGHQSKVIQTAFDWLNTYKSQAVTVNLSQSSAQGQQVLDQILMVYIDNSTNPVECTLYFVDSGQLVVAPAFTAGYYYVFTSNLFCTVYNGTTGQAPVTKSSVTQILFCNFGAPGFLAQNTLDVTFNSSTGPKIPVIGDKFSVNSNSFGGSSPQTIIILPTVALPEQYIITAIQVTSSQLYCDIPNAVTLDQGIATLKIYDASASAIIRWYNLFVPNDMTAYNLQTIDNETGLNIPCQNLSMDLSWLSTAPPNGIFFVSTTYALISL